jgi:hypothetical protein
VCARLVLLLAFALWPSLAMPAPTNISAATATDLGTLPASVSQNVHDAGTTYTVWYKYTPVTSQMIGVFGFGDLVTYRPTVTVFTGTGSTPVGIGVTNKPVQVYVNSGSTYWFRFISNGGNPTPAVLLIEAEAFVPEAVPLGSILVNDDTDGAPGVIVSAADGDDYHVIDFISPFPAGESGDVLRSTGLILMEDQTGGLKLYDDTLSLIASPAFSAGGATGDNIRANQTLNQFVAGNPGAGATPASVRIINADGSLGASHTLPTSGLSAVSLSNDGSIIYNAGQGGAFAAPVKRWLTGSSVMDTDLAAGVSGYTISSLMTLDDDSIIALYIKIASPRDIYAVRYAADGSTLHTYSIASGPADSLSPRLTHSMDPSSSFWVWFHGTSGNGIGTFREYSIAGSVLREVDHVDYENGSYQPAETATPVARFGVSSSCPFVVLGAAGGTIQVVKVTVPDGSAQSFDFTAGGGLTPTTFALSDGGTEEFTDVPAGDGYSISEAAVAGWSASFVVSNGSPPDNITVAAGETVIVTVTNTQEIPEVPDEGPCCATTGPAGAPTETGYNGTGTTGPKGTTAPTLTPRVIPPGGDAPSYQTCNSGGGTPATTADPADASSLVTCKTPMVHIKWTLPDASARRYGKRAFTSANGQAVSARVLRYGGVSQVLADRHGSFQASQWTVTLSDYDRAIRTILSTASTKYIDGKEMEMLIEDFSAGSQPFVLARGVVTDYKFRPDMTVDITVTDPLGYRYSSVSIDRPIPHRVWRKELFPGLPEEASGRAMPIIYGEESDDYTWSLVPERIPVGILPVVYLGPANTISAVGIPGGEWEAFGIAGHAISCVQSIFASNLLESPGPVRMATSTYGSEFLVPGIDVPLYYDITGSDGVTERVCLMFGTGERIEQHIAGTVPITINLAGIEDVGDGSGNTITETALQFQHFLSYWVTQNYLTGNWGAVPTFGDGTGKVRTSSFSAVNAVHAARLGTSQGYQGSMYIGDQKPAREWSKEFQTGGDMRLGVNHQGQLLVTTLDHTQSTVGLTTFTDEDHMVQQSFQIDPQISEVFNVYSHEYGVEPATGRNAGQAQTIRHPASITNHGERIAQARVNRATRQKPTADDVANRALLQSYDAPTDVAFDLDLRGTALKLGQAVKVTHYQGVGPLGWTDRNLVVTGVTAYPDEDNFSTSIELEDWHDVLALGGSVLEIDTGTIDTYTIG